MRRIILFCACFLSSLSGGCAAGVVTEVRYRPIATALPSVRAAVNLEVVDAREAKLGGKETNLVGQMRGTYGNPFALREAAPVTQIIAAATSDALQHAGVKVRPDASRTVTVTIKKYWVDGYLSYTADVVAEVALRDSEERTSSVNWYTATYRGGSPLRRRHLSSASFKMPLRSTPPLRRAFNLGHFKTHSSPPFCRAMTE